MSKYGLLDPGTCLPVLEAVTHVCFIDNVLEFGCGLWSTYCFTRNCKKVYSIEHDSEWIEIAKKEFAHKDNIHFIHKPENMASVLDDDFFDDFDLIFVDGEDRLECLQRSFNRAPIIVAHDTHQKSFGWGKLKVADGYKQLSYAGCSPYLTTIFYYEEAINLKDILQTRSHYTHQGTYIDNQYWTDQDIVLFHMNRAG